MLESKRVVVAGATGMIGKALCRSLQEHGYAVVVFSRNPQSARSAVPDAADYVAWSPEEQGPWAAAIDGAYAVINLAGASIAGKRWSESYKRLLRDSRITGTRSLVDAMARAEQRPQVLINASGVGYYGDRGDAPIDESAPPGDDFLARLCYDWEQEALRAEEHAVRVVVMRNGVVLDPSDGALPRLSLPFKLFVGGPILPGSQWLSWIHMADTVGLHLLALGEAQLSGPLNATAPEPKTNREFSRTLGRVLRRPSLFPVPGFALRLVVGEMAGDLIRGQRVLPAKALRHGYQFKFGELEPALRDLLQR